MTIADGYCQAGKQLNALSLVVQNGRLPEWLVDGLPDAPPTILAKTLRRGMFLSAFTVFEDFLRQASSNCTEAVNSLSLEINPLVNEGTEKKIFKRISDAVKNIPSWTGASLRAFLLEEYADAIKSAVHRNTLMIPRHTYYAGSNVNYASFKDFVNDMDSIWNDIYASNFPHADIKTVKGIEYLNNVVKSSDLVLFRVDKSPFEDCFDSLLDMRNHYAHGYDHAPGINDLRSSLKQLDVLLLTTASYLTWFERAFRTGVVDPLTIRTHWNDHISLNVSLSKASTLSSQPEFRHSH